MKYVSIIGGSSKKIIIEEYGSGKYLITVDGESFMVDSISLGDSSLGLIYNNKSYHVELEEGLVSIDGSAFEVDVVDTRSHRLMESKALLGGDIGKAKIVSPMPGKVVTVLVKDGQEVKEGDGLMVIEAMKMENEVKSPKDGVVRDLKAEDEMTVDGSEVLCIIE